MNTATLIRPDAGTSTTEDQPWLVFLWDDPVNTRGHVIRALQKVFGYSREKAAQLMLEADGNGRTVVFSGDLNEAETKASKLHTWALQATVSQDR